MSSVGFKEPLQPVVLENAFVRLEPLRLDHAADLAALTVGTGITRWFPEPLETHAIVDRYVAEGLRQAAEGLAQPFAIVDTDGPVVGCTRYMNVSAENRRLEIGSTFVGTLWQRSAINSAAKLLLLEHGFERLGCGRIELKTDARNMRSRNAILRIGATEEGTLRRHVVCSDGFLRDTVYFSILADEWPTIKTRLTARLG
jgi:RimJ/RimL family protein N-acetyltransferase